MANFIPQFTVKETFNCSTCFILTLSSSVRERSPLLAALAAGVGSCGTQICLLQGAGG